jgi:iron complex transport system ATP-binding protein
MVELSHVSYRVGDATLLNDVSLTFRQNQFNVIVGPNGAGKSTLMRIASGLTPPTSGSVTYLGEDVSFIENDALARRRAVLSQNVGLAFALTVEEVVLIGRFPHYGATPTKADREIVSRALEEVGIAERRKQAYPTLSGGEKQKVQLARVLAQIWATGNAQKHRVLFLDEPVTGLDVHYQLHILDSAKAMIASDCTVIAVLHDLNLAFDYADAVFIIDHGSVVLETSDAHGVPASVLEKVFDVSAEQVVVPDDGTPMWRFARRTASRP